VPIRLDPGPHSLVLEKAPTPAFIRNLDLKAGERVVVEAKLDEPAPTVVAPPLPLVVAPPVARVEPEKPSRWSLLDGKMKAAIGLGGVGVLALAFGAYEQLAASSKYKEFNDTSTAPNWTHKCDADPRVVHQGHDLVVGADDVAAIGRAQDRCLPQLRVERVGVGAVGVVEDLSEQVGVSGRRLDRRGGHRRTPRAGMSVHARSVGE